MSELSDGVVRVAMRLRLPPLPTTTTTSTSTTTTTSATTTTATTTAAATSATSGATANFGGGTADAFDYFDVDFPFYNRFERKNAVVFLLLFVVLS